MPPKPAILLLLLLLLLTKPVHVATDCSATRTAS
jgi:hypothetical protein